MLYKLLTKSIMFNNEQLISVHETEQDANKKMSEYLNAQGIEPPYYRIWQEDNLQYFDYGNYTQYMVIERIGDVERDNNM